MVYLKYQVRSVLPPHWQQHSDHLILFSGAADHLSRGMQSLTQQGSLKPWPTRHVSPWLQPREPYEIEGRQKKKKKNERF